MKRMELKGKINVEKGQIELQVPLISFIDDNTHIIYCPVLDLSGYGIDETEARKSLDIVLEEYLTYTTNKGSLWNDLKKLGWIVKKNKQRKAIPPPISDLLETNKEFNRIFNNYSFKKYSTDISLPAA